MFKELKKLSKHYTIYALGGIIGKAIGFIMIPVYTRFISPAEYGIVGILNLVVWVVSLIVGMNVVSGVTRFYYLYKSDKERNSVVSTSIFFIILVSLPIVLSLIYFSDALSQMFFKNIHYSLYFKITFAALFFEMLLPIPFACLRIKNKSFVFLQFSLLSLFIGLSLNIMLIVFLKLGILGIFYSQLITAFIMSPILLYITFKEFGFVILLGPVKKILSYSLPLIPAGLAMIVLNLGDRYILKEFVSLEQVGFYTLGYKIVMMLGFLVGVPFRYVWGPYRFSIAEDKNAPEIYSRVFTYFTLFIGFVGMGMAIFAKDIIRIIAAPSYFGASRVIPVLTLGYIFYQLYYLVNIGIFLKRKTKWVPYIVSAAAGLNVVINLLLIPKAGIMAAAYTTLASFAFLAIAGYCVSQRFYKISYEFIRVLKIIFVSVGLYFVSKTMQFENLLVDIFVKSIIIFLFPFILYLLGFYTKEEVVKVSQLMKSLKIKFKAASLKMLRLREGQ